MGGSREKPDRFAASPDGFAMIDEEGSRTLEIRSTGRLAGSRGWLRRTAAVAHCSGAVVAFALPDYDSDDVPHDESLRWCNPQLMCSGRPPRGTGAKSSKFHAVNRTPPLASGGGGSSGSGSSAVAAKAAGLPSLALPRPAYCWPSCLQDCQQQRLSSRCRPGGRELDRREEDEQRSPSPTPPPEPCGAWSQLSVFAQSAICEEPCFAPPLVTAALAGIPPSIPNDLAQRHDVRQKITGTVCFAVHYRSTKSACEDVPVVRVADGRAFVEDLDRSGLAYKAGVRPGDEIVRVKVATVEDDQTAGGSADILSHLRHDVVLASQPAVVFFMGFAGKFPAEVRVSGDEMETIKRTSMRDITNEDAFQLHDVVDFKQGAPLLIACRPLEPLTETETESGGQKRRVPKTMGDMDEAPTSEDGQAEDTVLPHGHSDRSDASPCGTVGSDSTFEAAAQRLPEQSPAPWKLIEVERREAKKLVAEAIYSLPQTDADGFSNVIHVKDSLQAFVPKSIST